MSAEFLPLYRLCGTSISSIAHSWNGRLYSVKRFQSAYARRTMILPFSSNRSSTSLISKALYCASLTPRAMFSKSMNSASLRSPFIRDVLSCADPARPSPLYVSVRGRTKRLWWRCIVKPRACPTPGGTHDTRRPRPRRAGPPGPDAHDEMARPHLRPHAPLRTGALDVPVSRTGRACSRLDVDGAPQAPACDMHLRCPLRHWL